MEKLPELELRTKEINIRRTLLIRTVKKDLVLILKSLFNE